MKGRFRTGLLAAMALWFMASSGGPVASASEPSTPSIPSTPSSAASIYLPLYAELLNEFTSESNKTVQTRVNYKALRKDSRWPQLVKLLGKVDPKTLGSRNEQLAFWINAYNVLAIDLVASAYPIDSIKDIGSFFTPVWEHEAGKIAGRAYTLEEIEHKILRPMKEPRIHSAIVCASVSCPPLARTPFTAAQLDAELDAIVASWLANPKKGLRIDRKSKTIHISKIFDWFKEDFEASGGALGFASPHLSAEDAAWIRAHRDDLSISYFGFDWGLND